MTKSPHTFRRLEVALWFLGIILIGVAAGETYDRWLYQAEQERALFAAPAPASAPVALPGRAPAPAPATPVSRVAKPVTPVMPVALQEKQADEQKPAPSVKPAAKATTNVAAKPAAPRGAFGLIEIPRLGVRAVVREGADDKTLARAVGLVPGGAYPGETGNTILAAHRDTFFRPLRKIRVDDRIRVVVPPDTYEYRVSSLKIVSPEETSVLQSRGVEELTLVTCYPFTFVGPAPDRFIVHAVREN
jgi:LPXTG-site transpeptidase (sortase) family protein